MDDAVLTERLRLLAQYLDKLQSFRKEAHNFRVISASILPILQEMARFRNLIVHNYAEIDHARVYGILKKRLGDFDAYAQAITDYLSRP